MQVVMPSILPEDSKELIPLVTKAMIISGIEKSSSLLMTMFIAIKNSVISKGKKAPTKTPNKIANMIFISNLYLFKSNFILVIPPIFIITNYI